VADALQTGVTRLLLQAKSGDQSAVDALFEKVYGELRGLAKNYLQAERPDHTLQATALVHEAYLRLIGSEQIEWQNRAQFFSIAAQVMRHILVDHARRHRSEKRGSGERKLSLDEAVSFAEDRDVNLVALDDALNTLAGLDEEQGRIVELRFFGGLSIAEMASVLDISETKVSRKWNSAKLWLHDQIAAKKE
jgi:RNA polymerase sigma factor (TIGR02999 family)